MKQILTKMKQNWSSSLGPIHGVKNNVQKQQTTFTTLLHILVFHDTQNIAMDQKSILALTMGTNKTKLEFHLCLLFKILCLPLIKIKSFI